MDERLSKLTEVLTRRFPDLKMNVDFMHGSYHKVTIFVFDKENKDILESSHNFLSLSTDQEIMKEAERMYELQKELENESRNETRR